MDIMEYLDKNNIIKFDTKDVPSIYIGNGIVPYDKYNNTYYMELNIDEIEDNFPISFEVSDFYVYKDTIYKNKNNLFDLSEYDFLNIVYKDDKFFPYDGGLGSIPSPYYMAAYLKQLKKQHPEIKIPNLICNVYDYKLDKEDEIYQEYLNELIHQPNLKLSSDDIFIDKNKQVSCLIGVFYKNRDGITVRKKFEKSNKEQIRNEIDALKKQQAINNYKKDYIGVEFNDNNELIFIANKKEVDINLVYEKCLKECVNFYKENLSKLKITYDTNKANVEKYKIIMQKISAINNNFDKYDNLSTSLKGKLKLLNKKERQVKPVGISINEGTNSLYGNYLANIEDSMKELSDYNTSDLSHLNLSEILDENKKINEFMKYVDYYFSSINNNLEKSEIYLNELEQQQSQIENQGIIKILKDPIKLERKPLVSSYSRKQEEKIEEPLKEDPFMNLQRKQANNLNSEEKNSLMVYKTLLYRPINQIIIKKRTNGITDEEINQIINSSYKELKERLSGPSNPLADRYAYKADIGVINNGEVVPYEDFKKIVLDAIPMLEKSLKQVTLDEPLTVYRGVSTSDVNKDEVGILSTTIDSDIALSFLSNIRDDNGNSVVYKINLPEGSPVNFFSTELFIGKVDEEHSAGAFGDAQKEVLIDSGNYNFEVVDMKPINDADIKRNNKTIYLVEINAHPKTLNMENNMENMEEGRVR